ncbi:MAG: hypothetical protein Q4G27_03175 [Flavobacteriaceae bacterium]|nr:hypothetical protein [Flavobacteriaceae bacterium]
MQAIIDLFFPRRCLHCTRIIPDLELPLCMRCYVQMPFTHWEMNRENLLWESLSREAEVEAASALLFYYQQNASKRLIMANKYYNMPFIGKALANLALPTIAVHAYDVITCVPSHHRTMRVRGYNQVSLFAKTLSENLQIPFAPDLLKRIKRKDSQTHKNRFERLNSLRNAFEVSDDLHQYNSILLVDDVHTTGATLVNCCKILHEKKNVKIYVYTMAKVL